MTLWDMKRPETGLWQMTARRGNDIGDAVTQPIQTVEFKPKDLADCERAIGELAIKLGLTSWTPEMSKISARSHFETAELLEPIVTEPKKFPDTQLQPPMKISPPPAWNARSQKK